MCPVGFSRQHSSKAVHTHAPQPKPSVGDAAQIRPKYTGYLRPRGAAQPCKTPVVNAKDDFTYCTTTTHCEVQFMNPKVSISYSKTRAPRCKRACCRLNKLAGKRTITDSVCAQYPRATAAITALNRSQSHDYVSVLSVDTPNQNIALELLYVGTGWTPKVKRSGFFT